MHPWLYASLLALTIAVFAHASHPPPLQTVMERSIFTFDAKVVKVEIEKIFEDRLPDGYTFRTVLVAYHLADIKVHQTPINVDPSSPPYTLYTLISPTIYRRGYHAHLMTHSHYRFFFTSLPNQLRPEDIPKFFIESTSYLRLDVIGTDDLSGKLDRVQNMRLDNPPKFYRGSSLPWEEFEEVPTRKAFIRICTIPCAIIACTALILGGLYMRSKTGSGNRRAI